MRCQRYFNQVCAQLSTHPSKIQVLLGVKAIRNHIPQHPEANAEFDDPSRDLGAATSQFLLDSVVTPSQTTPLLLRLLEVQNSFLITILRRLISWSGLHIFFHVLAINYCPVPS